MTFDYTYQGVTYEVTIELKDATASTELDEDRPPIIPLIIVHPDGSTSVPQKPPKP